MAERAAEIARASATPRSHDPLVMQALGEAVSALTTAQLAFADMLRLANDYDFAPDPDLANAALVRKTILANAAITTVEKVVEVVGGAALYRKNVVERLWRDVQGATFHPLPEKKQALFSARVTLGLPPVG